MGLRCEWDSSRGLDFSFQRFSFSPVPLNSLLLRQLVLWFPEVPLRAESREATPDAGACV